MIVLDTNVLSEPMLQKPDLLVTTWLAAEQHPLYTTAVSVGELLTGVRNLPAGKRRTGLLDAIETTLSVFSDRILPYDEPAARIYGEIQASRAGGAPPSVEDGMIAAILQTPRRRPRHPADSDLVPVVATLQTRFGIPVTVLDPPGRHSSELAGIASTRLHIARPKIAQAQLPEPVTYQHRGKIRSIHHPASGASSAAGRASNARMGGPPNPLGRRAQGPRGPSRA